MRTLFFLLVVSTLGCASGFPLRREGDPLPERELVRNRYSVTIWSLAREVDAVVVADVAGVHFEKPAADVSTTSATLALHTVLKGEVSGAVSVSKQNIRGVGCSARPI